MNTNNPHSNPFKTPVNFLNTTKSKIDQRLNTGGLKMPESFLEQTKAQLDKEITANNNRRWWLAAAAAAIAISIVAFWPEEQNELPQLADTMEVNDETLEWTEWEDLASLEVQLTALDMANREDLESFFLEEDWDWNDLETLNVEL